MKPYWISQELRIEFMGRFDLIRPVHSKVVNNNVLSQKHENIKQSLEVGIYFVKNTCFYLINTFFIIIKYLRSISRLNYALCIVRNLKLEIDFLLNQPVNWIFERNGLQEYLCTFQSKRNYFVFWNADQVLSCVLGYKYISNIVLLLSTWFHKIHLCNCWKRPNIDNFNSGLKKKLFLNFSFIFIFLLTKNSL